MFLFIDECKDREKTGIISLTGLLVPFPKYKDIRNNFYDDIPWMIRDGDMIYPHPKEIKGSNFLCDFDDEKKFEVMSSMVKIIIESQLQIIRVGYYFNSLPEVMRTDKGALGMCFYGILSVMQEDLKKAEIYPVVDLDNKDDFVGTFSAQIQSMQNIGKATSEENISIKNYPNIADVMFSDSKYSVFLQLVDFVSYLLHVKDASTDLSNMSSYKVKLLDYLKEINPLIKYNEVIRMKWIK